MPPRPRLLAFGRHERPSIVALAQGAAILGRTLTVQRIQYFRPKEGLYDGVEAVFVDGAIPEIVSAYQARHIPVYILDNTRLRAMNEMAIGIFRETLADLPIDMGNEAVVRGLVKARKGTKPYALVCGQKPGDRAHGLSQAEQAAWATDTIAAVRQQYSLPVLYRPHPLDLQKRNLFGADGAMMDDLLTALEAAAMVVTYNSTVGVDAIDAGVPVVFTAPREKVSYHGYATPFGLTPRVLTETERTECLLRNAACTWTYEQLRDGTTLSCLLQGTPLPPAKLTIKKRERRLRMAS